MTEWQMAEELFIFNEGQFDFEFNLDVDYVEGLDKVENRVEECMNEIIEEELECVCFTCGFDKMKSEEKYYCPKCEE